MRAIYKKKQKQSVTVRRINITAKTTCHQKILPDNDQKILDYHFKIIVVVPLF